MRDRKLLFSAFLYFIFMVIAVIADNRSDDPLTKARYEIAAYGFLVIFNMFIIAYQGSQKK